MIQTYAQPKSRRYNEQERLYAPLYSLWINRGVHFCLSGVACLDTSFCCSLSALTKLLYHLLLSSWCNMTAVFCLNTSLCCWLSLYVKLCCLSLFIICFCFPSKKKVAEPHKCYLKYDFISLHFKLLSSPYHRLYKTAAVSWVQYKKKLLKSLLFNPVSVIFFSVHKFCILRWFKGTQDWEFFWLRFWNLYFSVDS